MRIQARWFVGGLLAGILASVIALALGIVAVAPVVDHLAPAPRAIAARSAPSPTVAPRRNEPADPTATATFLPTPSPSRRLPGQPPVTTDLRAQLDCDQAYWHGQEVPDYAFGPGGPSGQQAFERVIDLHLVPYLPLRGYTVEPLGDHWARLVYSPGGRTKALAVATDTSPEFADGAWHLVGLMVCASVEFDPADGLSTGDAVWTDKEGRPVAPSVLEQRGDCYGGTQLRLGGRLYVRDPLGQAYEPQSLLTRYDGDTSLPADASATGYRERDRTVFTVKDRSAVYVVSPAGTERWPRVRGDRYDRTDCN